MDLLSAIKSAKGRNQARMKIKEYCEELGLNYKEYKLTQEESRAYFFKVPYSPYSGFSMKGRDRE